MAIPAGLVLIAAFALSYSFKKGLALVLWVRIMQASDSTKLLFYPFAIKKFHNYVCFPLLLALHTLVTLFSFQGAVLTWSQIQTLVRTNAWIQIQRHVKFSLPSFFFKRKKVVEINGIEPLTPCLQSRCSPSWAMPPRVSCTAFGGSWWTRTIDPRLIKTML